MAPQQPSWKQEARHEQEQKSPETPEGGAPPDEKKE
jgi:hypothetical protein